MKNKVRNIWPAYAMIGKGRTREKQAFLAFATRETSMLSAVLPRLAGVYLYFV